MAENGCVHPTDAFSIPQRKLLKEMSEISSLLLTRTWKIGGNDQKNTAEAAQPWCGGESPGDSASCPDLSRGSPLLPLQWAV